LNLLHLLLLLLLLLFLNLKGKLILIFNYNNYFIFFFRIKQVEIAKEKHENDLHEMQKPLARYADDSDLEKLLKSKIRDGDPMLEYIAKNKGTGESSPDGVRHG